MCKFTLISGIIDLKWLPKEELIEVSHTKSGINGMMKIFRENKGLSFSTLSLKIGITGVP